VSFADITTRNERGFHIFDGLVICFVGLIVTVTVGSNGEKYAGLGVFLFSSYVSAPFTVVWLAGNTPEPGMRALVLGVNGFGNFAGVIGSQQYQSKYAPGYRLPFYVTLGFIAVALAGCVIPVHPCCCQQEKGKEAAKDDGCGD